MCVVLVSQYLELINTQLLQWCNEQRVIGAKDYLAILRVWRANVTEHEEQSRS